jgi:hypothetical protein
MPAAADKTASQPTIRSFNPQVKKNCGFTPTTIRRHDMMLLCLYLCFLI